MRCPNCRGTRPTFENISDRVVMEVCDCGYVIHKRLTHFIPNPDNFIKKEPQVFERRAVLPEDIGVAAL